MGLSSSLLWRAFQLSIAVVVGFGLIATANGTEIPNLGDPANTFHYLGVGLIAGVLGMGLNLVLEIIQSFMDALLGAD